MQHSGISLMRKQCKTFVITPPYPESKRSEIFVKPFFALVKRISSFHLKADDLIRSSDTSQNSVHVGHGAYFFNVFQCKRELLYIGSVVAARNVFCIIESSCLLCNNRA